MGEKKKKKRQEKGSFAWKVLGLAGSKCDFNLEGSQIGHTFTSQEPFLGLILATPWDSTPGGTTGERAKRNLPIFKFSGRAESTFDCPHLIQNLSQN